MKHSILYTLLIAVTVCIFTACYKDKGNYSYHDTNKISFANIDTVKGYTVFFADTLKITPVLTMTADNNPSADGYSYEWTFRFGTTATGFRDSVIATGKDLKVPVVLAPGTYTLQYRVTDKATGIQFHIRTTVLVSTAVYEGYMVLNEVNGQSRLDMLSYSKTTGVFTQLTDVLKKMESPLPPQGTPYQVLCVNYTNANITSQNYGIFLLTASGTNRVSQETFGWDPAYNIRYLMLGSVPSDFKAQRLTGEPTSTIYPMFYMYADGNMYNYATLSGYAFKYTPLNVYTPSGVPFKVSPYVVTDGSSGLMYNMDKRNFVTAASYSSTSMADVPVALNYPTGYDLVWMGRCYNNTSKYAYAIMKDPATSKYYLMRFVLGKAQDYLKEITATDFANATNFAVSPDRNYLFYTVGGKLYEYDFNAGTPQTILMLDKGASTISHLGFTRFYNYLVAANANTYKVWANYLSVGSYDPSGTAGSNGTLELYSVPDVNRQIEKVSSWTGMGKIVSVAYRER